MICIMNVLILLLFIKCLHGAEEDQKTLLNNDVHEIKKLNSTQTNGMYLLCIAPNIRLNIIRFLSYNDMFNKRHRNKML